MGNVESERKIRGHWVMGQHIYAIRSIQGWLYLGLTVLISNNQETGRKHCRQAPSNEPRISRIRCTVSTTETAEAMTWTSAFPLLSPFVLLMPFVSRASRSSSPRSFWGCWSLVPPYTIRYYRSNDCSSEFPLRNNCTLARRKASAMVVICGI